MWELSPGFAGGLAPPPAPVRGLAAHHARPRETPQNLLYYYYNVTISDSSTRCNPCIFDIFRNFHKFS
jgi:hypothetical protein